MNDSRSFSCLARASRLFCGPGALVLLIAAAAVPAQLNPGDIVIAPGRAAIYASSAGGAMRTVVVAPVGGAYVAGVTIAANNRDIVATATPNNLVSYIFQVTPGGVVTRLATLFPMADKVVPDEDGSYLAPILGGPLSVARITASGVVTTIKATPPPATGGALGVCVDIGTGDYLVTAASLPWQSSVYRMDRTGRIVALASSLMFWPHADVLSDARTGFALAVSGSQPDIYRVNPVTGHIATMARHRWYFTNGLAYERQRDTWAVAANWDLLRLDRRGRFTSLAYAGFQFLDVEVYGCRNVVATSRPQVGTAFPLAFSELASPLAFYLAAASLSHLPGIPTPAGTLDLRPDPLFSLSLSNPVLFRGFSGWLDAQGRAQASIQIPNQPGLRGMRFYVSFITFAGGRIAAIANTAGFTIT